MRFILNVLAGNGQEQIVLICSKKLLIMDSTTRVEL